MADLYNNDKNIAKQLTRIANSLERIEKKIPDAHNIIFSENLLGGLAIGVNKSEFRNYMDIESEE